jgi:hypothetical protein
VTSASDPSRPRSVTSPFHSHTPPIQSKPKTLSRQKMLWFDLNVCYTYICDRDLQIPSLSVAFLPRCGKTWDMAPSFMRFLYHTQWHTHSVGLLWTSDQPVTETSTWQHTTLTRDGHPCSRPQTYDLVRAATGTGSIACLADLRVITVDLLTLTWDIGLPVNTPI